MLGYEARCVSTGEAAMRELRQRPCSLVLLDLMMPGMSGFDVLRAMGFDRLLRDVPVVICSAMDRDENWNQVRALGARDYLVKAEKTFMAQLKLILLTYVGSSASAAA
jgi:DNA-binding response OmpR family regulator